MIKILKRFFAPERRLRERKIKLMAEIDAIQLVFDMGGKVSGNRLIQLNTELNIINAKLGNEGRATLLRASQTLPTNSCLSSIGGLACNISSLNQNNNKGENQ